MSVAARRPAYEALADAIRAQITSGRLRPGDRLPTEPQLGQRTGVSRSTVREALRQLASQHLIVTTRGVAGGSFVAHPSPAQLSDSLTTGVRLLHASAVVGIEELLEVREVFDVAVAGLAARRRTDAQVAAMRAVLVDPLTTEPSAMIAKHAALHVELAAATGNALLELVTRPLYAAKNSGELTAHLGRAFWVQVDTDHRAIVAAVEASCAEAAEDAAARHMARLRSALTPAAATSAVGV